MIELKEGDVIVDKDELGRLMQELEDLRDEKERNKNLKAKSDTQTVLMNQTVFVVAEIEKVIPGLFSGQGLAGINIMDLMSGSKIQHLGPHCEQLKKLIDGYKEKYPIVIAR